jgi:hypothetical protein
MENYLFVNLGMRYGFLCDQSGYRDRTTSLPQQQWKGEYFHVRPQLDYGSGRNTGTRVTEQADIVDPEIPGLDQVDTPAQHIARLGKNRNKSAAVGKIRYF